LKSVIQHHNKDATKKQKQVTHSLRLTMHERTYKIGDSYPYFCMSTSWVVE